MALDKRITLKEAENDKILLTKAEIYGIIRTYIQDQIDLCHRKQGKEENFALPAWPQFQAYQLGTIKGLEKLLDFVPNLTKDK